MKKLIVVTGPTASGKTALALQLAKHFGLPVIGADSRQMYRRLKIGTAAPTEQQLREVRHLFVGQLELDAYYNASIYEQQVLEQLRHQFAHSDYALMCGGSMMYIDAVCHGIDDIPTVDAATREALRLRLQREGLEALCQDLRRLDPEHYAVVDLKNPRRVVHALEICTMTGKTYTSFRHGHTRKRPFQTVKIGIDLPREELYTSINRRTDQMMHDGLLSEAHSLLPHRGLNALNTVGYKELFLHFDGQLSLPEAVERIKGSTRRYARKQLTWLRRDPSVAWFAPHQQEEVIKHIEAIK